MRYDVPVMLTRYDLWQSLSTRIDHLLQFVMSRYHIFEGADIHTILDFLSEICDSGIDLTSCECHFTNIVSCSFLSLLGIAIPFSLFGIQPSYKRHLALFGVPPHTNSNLSGVLLDHCTGR